MEILFAVLKIRKVRTILEFLEKVEKESESWKQLQEKVAKDKADVVENFESVVAAGSNIFEF